MEDKNLYLLFKKIYRSFSKGIIRFIYFKVSDYEIAQELAADTFIRYWKALVKGTEIKNDKAFLYFIARGLTIDYYRKKSKIKNVNIDTIDERLLGVIDNSEDRLSQKQELDEVFKKLSEIKKEYRDVLLLHYVEDLEIAKIAFILSKKENNIRVTLHRALKSLKEKL